MNELVSATAFTWFMSAMTAGLAGFWLVYDAWSLARSGRTDRTDPITRDKIFGYVIGIAIGGVGVFGVVMHHLQM